MPGGDPRHGEAYAPINSGTSTDVRLANIHGCCELRGAMSSLETRAAGVQ